MTTLQKLSILVGLALWLWWTCRIADNSRIILLKLSHLHHKFDFVFLNQRTHEMTTFADLVNILTTLQTSADALKARLTTDLGTLPQQLADTKAQLAAVQAQLQTVQTNDAATITDLQNQLAAVSGNLDTAIASANAINTEIAALDTAPAAAAVTPPTDGSTTTAPADGSTTTTTTTDGSTPTDGSAPAPAA